MTLPRALTRLPGVALALLLCALPAHGNEVALPLDILYMLTPIDCAPTPQELTHVLGTDEIRQLHDFALDPVSDFGMRLRATRAIPNYCRTSPDECHVALIDVVDKIKLPIENESSGRRILRQRAAIEALGAAHSGQSGDLARLAEFLNHNSRDVRVSAVRAMRDLCDREAIRLLEDRLRVENTTQVRLVISSAIDVLETCSR